MQFIFATFVIVLASIASANAIPGARALARAEIQRRTCGTLTGTALKVCQTACKAVCETATIGLAKPLCKAACDAPPLKARDIDTIEVRSAGEEADEDEADESVEERSIGKTLCDGACDVTCNSTVLALAQTKCLSTCKALC